jgi:hypothetical protein
MYVHYVHCNKLNSRVERCTIVCTVCTYYPRSSLHCLRTAVVSASKGCTNLWYKRFHVQKKWVTSAIFIKYLQCIRAAKILHVGSDHSLVSPARTDSLHNMKCSYLVGGSQWMLMDVNQLADGLNAHKSLFTLQTCPGCKPCGKSYWNFLFICVLWSRLFKGSKYISHVFHSN